MSNQNPEKPSEWIQHHDSTIRQLENLMKMEGWEILVKYMRHEALTAFTEMQKAVTGDMAMKAATAFTTINTMIDFPEKQAAASRYEIARLTELIKLQGDQ